MGPTDAVLTCLVLTRFRTANACVGSARTRPDCIHRQVTVAEKLHKFPFDPSDRDLSHVEDRV
jgi:hypothetical protein